MARTSEGLIKDLPRALHDEGVKDTAVTVIANLSNIDRDSFWFVMDVTQFALRGPAGSVGNSNGAQIGDYVRHFDDACFPFDLRATAVMRARRRSGLGRDMSSEFFRMI